MSQYKAKAEIFVKFEHDFGLLGERIQDALLEADRSINEMLQRLNDYVRKCQDDVEIAHQELESCLGRENAECSWEEEQVYRAENALQEAEAELRLFEDAQDDYRDREPGGRRVLERDIPDILAQLRAFEQAIDRLRALQLGWTSVDSGGISETGAPSSGNTLSKTSNTDWVTSYTQININELPEPEHINGASDFEKVSIEDMRDGLIKLQMMLSRIESGEGANGDYWSRRDETEGLTIEKGYRRIYDAFYGNDAIYVTKNDGKYNIINGRHRIWLAKRMGIAALPVKLAEKRP